jgi:hypothetical protein
MLIFEVEPEFVGDGIGLKKHIWLLYPLFRLVQYCWEFSIVDEKILCC